MRSAAEPLFVSASRRTDIPAFHADWLLARLREGFARVRNPFDPNRVRTVPLSREATAGIVLWTKDPSPLLEPEEACPPGSRPLLRIEVLERTGIPFYVQFTLTPYGVELEPRVPPVDRAVETFLRLSGRIGPDRVVWRYDPILLGGGWEIRDHLRSFEALALRLAGATRRCTLSFLDFYPRIRRRLERMGLREIAPEERGLLAEGILRIARPLGIRADLCAEPPGPGLEGIPRARCVDPVLLGFSTDEGASFRRDRNQRPCCGCAPSADIGAYGTCGHGCRYCYAGSGDGRPDRALRSDPLSPLLNG